MYALNLLDDLVRDRVISMGPEELHGFLGNLWGSLQRPEHGRVVRSRLAQVTAQCMLRVWPQRWPDAFDRLLTALNDGGSRETSLMIMAQVMAALHPTEEEATPVGERSHELREALSLCMPMLTEWIRPNAQGLLTIAAGLELLRTMLPWATLDTAIVNAILPPLTERAACRGDRECLEVLMSLARRPTWSTEADLAVRELILTQQLPFLAQQLHALLSRKGEDEDYQLAKGLVDYLIDVSTHSLRHHPPKQAGEWQPILSLMTGLMGVPSLLIAASLAQWWVTMLKVLGESAPSLIPFSELTVSLMQQLGWTLEQERRRPFNRIDFADSDSKELAQLFTAHRSRVSDLLRLLAQIDPAMMVGLTQQALGALPPALWMQLLDQVCRGIGPGKHIEGLAQLLVLLLQELIAAPQEQRLMLLTGIRAIIATGISFDHAQVLEQLLPLVGLHDDSLVAGRACDTLLLLPVAVLNASSRRLEACLKDPQTPAHVERFVLRLLIRAGCTGLVLSLVKTRLSNTPPLSLDNLVNSEYRKHLMSVVNLVMVVVQTASDKISDDFAFIQDWVLALLRAHAQMPRELLAQPPANQTGVAVQSEAGWLWMLQSTSFVILGMLVSKIPQTTAQSLSFLWQPTTPILLWQATALLRHVWIPMIAAAHEDARLASLVSGGLWPTVDCVRKCLAPAWQEYRQRVQDCSVEDLVRQQEMEKMLQDCTFATISVVHDAFMAAGEREARKDVPMERGQSPQLFKSTSKLTPMLPPQLLTSIAEDASTLWQPTQQSLGRLLTVLNRWYPLLRSQTGPLLNSWGKMTGDHRNLEHYPGLVNFITELIKLHLYEHPGSTDLPAEFVDRFSRAASLKSERNLVKELFPSALPTTVQRKEMPRLLEKLKLPAKAETIIDPLDTVGLDSLFN